MSSHVAIIPEVDVDPLGDMMLDFLIIDWDNEDCFLDFKETLEIGSDAPFAKIAKDIFAFSNYGGGFLLIGYTKNKKNETEKDGEETEEIKRNYIPVGVDEHYDVDQAVLQEKFNSYCSDPIELRYIEYFRIVGGVGKKFGAVYIPPSTGVLKPNKIGSYKKNNKDKVAFKVGEVLFRRGTQSVPASEKEIKYIEQRSREHGYKLSVLSGEPDKVKEKIYANCFEVLKIPEYVHLVRLRVGRTADQLMALGANQDLIFTQIDNNEFATISSLNLEDYELNKIIQPDSIISEQIKEWIRSGDKLRILIELLNLEINKSAYNSGLLFEELTKKFYYECTGEDRYEKWKTRSGRISPLLVGQKKYAIQLKRFIYYHAAMKAHFRFIGGKFFLFITPSILITEDGKKALYGTEQGTVITRIIHNKHNDSYLNSILFWISRLQKNNTEVLLGNGEIRVSARPVETILKVGIINDRPANEEIESCNTVD